MVSASKVHRNCTYNVILLYKRKLEIYIEDDYTHSNIYNYLLFNLECGFTTLGYPK